MSFLSHTRRLIAAVVAAGILTVCAGTGAIAATPTPSPSPTSPGSGVPGSADDEGPQFYSGLMVEVSGDVDGDVYASGQSITISGDITGDVIAAGQSITITGTVDGNVRLAAQDVTVDGEVSRSGTIFAADLTVADTGSFGDDLVGAVGAVTIDGEIGRDLFVNVGELTIDGVVGGDVTYFSDDEAEIAPGAVDGDVTQIEPPDPAEAEAVSPVAAFIGWFLGLLYALVALSLFTLLAGLLFPRLLRHVTDQLVPSPWKALLVGFVAAICVPFVLLFLLVTFVGAPLALVGIVVWFLMVLATFVYSAFYIGRLLFRHAQRPVVMALVGGVILITALQIPWLNIFVWLAMVFFGLGAQLLAAYDRRPWRTTRGADTAPPVSPPAAIWPATPPPAAPGLQAPPAGIPEAPGSPPPPAAPDAPPPARPPA